MSMDYGNTRFSQPNGTEKSNALLLVTVQWALAYSEDSENPS